MTAVNLLARGYRFDVSTDGSTWVRPKGLNNLAPSFDPNLEDANEYDSDGFGSQEITLQNWSVSVGMNRKADAGVEDAGQVLIRATQAQFGDSARLYVRWYRTDGIAEAWSGRALVSVSPSGTSTTDIASWDVTFTGDGVVTAIANPYAAASVPVISSVSPATGAAAGGTLITIRGQNFTGTVATTGVKFGGVNAPSWSVVSDSTIVAVTPAHAAGLVDVLVTNATGPSTTGTGDYTYV